jgi:hypothetical protein
MTNLARPFTLALLFALLAILLVIAGHAPWTPQVIAARADGSVIAYVRPNNQNGDEIRFVSPDGANDRRVWQTGIPDPSNVEEITSLAWKHDATELAFDGNHERTCSLLDRDVFAIRPSGFGYRRITQAPACAELASYPKGTVHVPVRNQTSATVFFPYFQGAPGVKQISLGPGQSTTVTFENVADFGPGQPQWAIVLGGAGRWFDAGVSVDVQAGAEVTTPLLVISGAALPEFRASWPTWHRDGSKLAYVFGLGTMYQIRANPSPLEIGDLLLPAGTPNPLFVDNLTWGPTEATANQLLYGGGGDFGQPAGIYRTTAGSNSAGERLVSFESYDAVLGLAWLPDASGFVYAVTEEFLRRSNVFIYHFTTGQSTRLTSFTNEFVGILTVSPDGQQIAFDRAASEFPGFPYLVGHDLWIVNRDGTGLRLLVDNARAPAWSPPEPPVSEQRLVLPLVTRD